METTTTNKVKQYRVQSKGKSSSVEAPLLTHGRYLIGRSENCDIILHSLIVSSIHAVLEISPSGYKIFDLNSKNGCFINGEKVITEKVELGDVLKCADVEFEFALFQEETTLPPVLESVPSSRIMPEPPTIKDPENINVPYIVYPLDKDGGADDSEYIFEEEDSLYPIFKYEYSHQSIEVITLFNDRVYSVDYLNDDNANYFLKGIATSENDLEWPALAATEKLNFVEINSGNCLVHNLPGYELFHLDKDKLVSRDENTVNLQGDDIITLRHNQVEIFLRKVPSPPTVKSPPFFRIEKALKMMIALVVMIIFITITAFNFYEVDEEMIKEKNPERLATILYKRQMVPNVKTAVEKTDKKKAVKQTSKKKILVKKTQKKSAEQTTKTSSNKKVVVKKPGKKSAEKVVVQKKVKAPAKMAKTIGKPKTSTVKVARAKTQRAVVKKSAGHVDVYKSFNFKSTVSSLVAKGGAIKGANIKAARSANEISSANVGGGISNVKSAQINQEVGSLTGAATGKIAASKGAEGLSAKTQIATAGIPAETVVLGSMDPGVIRSILREHLPQFRYCYQRALDSSSSDVSGVVKMNFIIGASGHVTRAGVQSSARRVPGGVKKCMVNVLKGIKFPAPLGGGKVEVNQPFNLYPKRS